MIELYYDAFDLACIIHSLDMGTKTASSLLETIWKQDGLYLVPAYRQSLRKLYLDVYHWVNYLCDKPAIDSEFPFVQKDFLYFGKELTAAQVVCESDLFNVDLFFKLRRIQILYLDGQDHVRMKLRTLLKAYGYQRRTQGFLKYFRECLLFYHMQTYLRGGEECDIGEIGLDQMITLRVI